MNQALSTKLSGAGDLGPTLASAIATAIRLSEQMLCHAKSSHWELIDVLEDERRKVLRAIFGTPIPAAYSEIVSEAIAIMIHLNEEVMELVNDAKAAAAVNHSRVKSEHGAVGHYLDVDSFPE
ncbi:MAG: flagellar protein FliT [Pseudomonadota bacterium]|nr:flagellar protein FliT [Pseudomonadota bacterium]